MAVEGQANGAVTTPKLADEAVTTEKIADEAVTYVKMQEISATDRLLGRVSASAGIVEEVVLDTDGTLAANSDDRVSTQKAVKTYVDAAVGGGGAKIVRQFHLFNATASTAGATSFPTASLVGVSKTGTYKLQFNIATFTNTGACHTLTIKTQTAQTFCEYVLVVAGSGASSTRNTLIAANTTIGSFAKGASFALGDAFIIESSGLSLTKDMVVGTNYNTSNNGAFMYVVNGTTLVIYGECVLIEQ